MTCRKMYILQKNVYSFQPCINALSPTASPKLGISTLQNFLQLLRRKTASCFDCMSFSLSEISFRFCITFPDLCSHSTKCEAALQFPNSTGQMLSVLPPFMPRKLFLFCMFPHQPHQVCQVNQTQKLILNSSLLCATFCQLRSLDYDFLKSNIIRVKRS